MQTQTVITMRRYPNRKLYGRLDGTRAGYYTIPDIYEQIKAGKLIKIEDNVTKQDITVKVLSDSLSILDLTLDTITTMIKNNEVKL